MMVMTTRRFVVCRVLQRILPVYAAHLLVDVVAVVRPVRFCQYRRNERGDRRGPEADNNDEASRRLCGQFAIAKWQLSRHVSMTTAAATANHRPVRSVAKETAKVNN